MTKMDGNSDITVLILLDAFRWDYISKEFSPFLHRFSDARNSITGLSRELFGFQMRDAFFAGLYPESSNISNMYIYSPETSPFKFTKYMPAIFDKLPRFKHLTRNVITKRVRKKITYSALKCYATPIEMPINLLQYFDFSEKYLPWEKHLNVPTLFDMLKENNFKWEYFGWSIVTDYNSDRKIVEEFKQRIGSSDSFIYIHLSQLDGLGHIYGPESIEVKKGVNEIDSLVKQILDHSNQIFDKVNFNCIPIWVMKINSSTTFISSFIIYGYIFFL